MGVNMQSQAKAKKLMLNKHLELWALWCHSGCLIRLQKSSIGKLIDNRGVMIPATSGGDIHDCIESSIEGVVAKLFNVDSLAADIIRLIYCAGWQDVIKRRRLDPRFTPYNVQHRHHADLLNIPLRSYERRLKKGLDTIAQAIY